MHMYNRALRCCMVRKVNWVLIQDNAIPVKLNAYDCRLLDTWKAGLNAQIKEAYESYKNQGTLRDAALAGAYATEYAIQLTQKLISTIYNSPERLLRILSPNRPFAGDMLTFCIDPTHTAYKVSLRHTYVIVAEIDATGTNRKPLDDTELEPGDQEEVHGAEGEEHFYEEPHPTPTQDKYHEDPPTTSSAPYMLYAIAGTGAVGLAAYSTGLFKTHTPHANPATTSPS